MNEVSYWLDWPGKKATKISEKCVGDALTKLTQVASGSFVSGHLRPFPKITPSEPQAEISKLSQAGSLTKPTGSQQPEPACTMQDESTIRGTGEIPAPTECYACRGRLFWRSIYGVVICWRCHAPGSERLVADILWDGEVKWRQ
jgi:hypothetical protein